MSSLDQDRVPRPGAAGPGDPGSYRDRVVALTQRLVRIPSENPPGKTREACDVVAEELTGAGFSVRYVEDTPGFVSVIGEYTFSDDGPTLVFNGHLDVVPVGDSRDDWTHEPFGGEVQDGRIYGRGSLDMKGAVSAVIVAAQSAVADGAGLTGKLVVTAVADEEAGGERGTGVLAHQGLVKGDGAVVVEPGDGGIITAHRGLCFVELTTHGRSAHASQPHEGVNAVQIMVDVLTSMRSLKLSHTPHAIFGGPSVVPGTTIHGGQKVNVIPDTCGAMMDIRTVPGMSRETVAREIADHAAACGIDPAALSVQVANWGEPGETADDARIVGVCADAFRQEFGHTPEIRSMPAYTDGGWLANIAGIPTVMAFGPGEIAGCHIVDESVVIDELERYTRIYRSVIDRFLGMAR
jgi:acetylornithine deacetylase/succinyl-diaminopimelate desuccinylase family protein